MFTGYSWGDLPVTYLGLPLITKCLSRANCQPLLMKICSKLQLWTNIFLSFAGRLQLIKTVLMGIFNYWAGHLFLPVSILKDIQSKCARFLWAGINATSCHYKVSWKDCCLPTCEGGLGLRDLKEWNLAASIFQLWRLLQPNSSSLWVQLFKAHILRGKGIWTLSNSKNLSWSVKKILLTRDIVKRFIKYQVGVSSRFLLWHDPWLCSRPLILEFGEHLISVTESSNLALVSSIILNGVWDPHNSNHVHAIELRHLLQSCRIFTHDRVVWDNIYSQPINISSIWNSIRRSSSAPSWLHVLWHSLHIPKCSFILWLGLKNRLLTRDRMIQFGMNTPAHCVLCNSLHESAHHLLMHCPYMRQILDSSPLNTPQDWIADVSNSNPSLLHKINYLFIGAAFYHVWLERNSRVHNNVTKPVFLLISNIKQMVRHKVQGCKQFQCLVRTDPSIASILY